MLCAFPGKKGESCHAVGWVPWEVLSPYASQDGRDIWSQVVFQSLSVQGLDSYCSVPAPPSTCRFCLFVLSVIGSQSLGPSRWWHTSSLAMLHKLPLHDWARAAPLPDSTRLTQWQPSFSSHSWIWWKKWRGGLGGRAEHPAPPPLIPRPSVDERSPSLSL